MLNFLFIKQIQQSNHIQPALRGLKTAPNLCWTDFQLKTGTSSLSVSVGRHTFHQAVWGVHHVTLAIIAGVPASGTISGLGNFNLQAVTEFSDLVPSIYLVDKENTLENSESSKQIQGKDETRPQV